MIFNDTLKHLYYVYITLNVTTVSEVLNRLFWSTVHVLVPGHDSTSTVFSQTSHRAVDFIFFRRTVQIAPNFLH